MMPGLIYIKNVTVSMSDGRHVMKALKDLNRVRACYAGRFVTFDDDAAVDRVFQAGSMQTLAGKKVEIKPATPRSSNKAYLSMSANNYAFSGDCQ